MRIGPFFCLGRPFRAVVLLRKHCEIYPQPKRKNCGGRDELTDGLKKSWYHMNT